MRLTRDARPMLFGATLLVLSSCRGRGDEDYADLSVVIPTTPVVTREAGKTYIFIDYLVRDNQGDPLTREDFFIATTKNGSPLDAESIGDSSNTPLTSSLNYHLVLDASYSMLTHDPPAFHPMLEAASSSIDEISAIWLANGGDFYYGITWFNEWIYEAKGQWSAQDIASIPEPPKGTATRLFCAAEFAARKLQGDYSDGIASGPRDRHIMLVLSDGKDNYSHYDQVDPSDGKPPPALPACEPSGDMTSCVTESAAEYQIVRSHAVTLEALEDAIAEHDNLTVNVLGLGSSVNSDELQRIADAGSGEYIHNPDPAEVHDLFRSALQQFIDQHTIWFQLPEPEGKNKLVLEFVTASHLERAKARCTVEYDTVGEPLVTAFSCDPQ